MNDDGNGWALLYEETRYEGCRWQNEWDPTKSISDVKKYSITNYLMSMAPSRFITKLKKTGQFK